MEKENIVVELSGKDSIVALLTFVDKAEKEDKKYNFIFSIAYVPSEYDDNTQNNIFSLGEILKMHVQRYGHEVSEMLYSAETGVWFKVIKPSFSAKYAGTTCLNCLTYCHLCRLDLAATNDAAILTGERLQHSTKIKTNQSKEIFDFFDKYFAKHDVKFIRPLLDITMDEAIDIRYEDFCTDYGFDVDTYSLPKCHLSGNIEDVAAAKSNVLKYLEELGEHMDNILDEYRYESNKLQ